MPVTCLAVIGTGYVGLATGACLAHLGHDVVCSDVDEDKVDMLSAGVAPIVEDGIDRLLAEGLRTGRLRFVTSSAEAARECEIAFLCVPTPSSADGSVDMSFLESASTDIGEALRMEALAIYNGLIEQVMSQSSPAECDRMGAMPAPPPTKTISFFVSRAKNSPKGPEIVTSSPGFRLKMYDDMMPGGTFCQQLLARSQGGLAIRTLSMMMPSSSG